MYTSGFVLLYRDELQDWLFDNIKHFHWWLYLRMRATPKPSVQTVGSTGIKVYLNHGDFATTKAYLASVWGVDTRSVTTFLEVMEETGRISIRRENNVFIIHINEYKKFSPPAGYFSKMRRGFQDSINTETEYEMETEETPPMLDETLPQIHAELQGELQTNKIILEEEKIKKNFSPPSREREIEFFENLKNSEITLDELAKNLRLPDRAAVLEQLEVFKSFILPGEKFHTDYGDFKRHFMSWYRSVSSKTTTNQKDQTNGTKNGKSVRGAEKRRGTEGSGKTPEDYDQPFPVRNE